MSEKAERRRERERGVPVRILHYQKLKGNSAEDEKNWGHGSRGQQKAASLSIFGSIAPEKIMFAVVALAAARVLLINI